MTLEDRTRQVVADVLGIALERVTLDTSHRDVSEWDSLNIINMVMAVESEFGVTLEVDDAARFTSVGAIVAVLRERGAT